MSDEEAVGPWLAGLSEGHAAHVASLVQHRLESRDESGVTIATRDCERCGCRVAAGDGDLYDVPDWLRFATPATPWVKHQCVGWSPKGMLRKLEALHESAVRNGGFGPGEARGWLPMQVLLSSALLEDEGEAALDRMDVDWWPAPHARIHPRVKAFVASHLSALLSGNEEDRARHKVLRDDLNDRTWRWLHRRWESEWRTLYASLAGVG